MNVGWNYRREHLRLQQRSHYVITDGGDQPNVVPRTASVWYYFRELDFESIKNLWAIGDKMAEGATLMTNTKFTSRVLGSAWPSHMNRPLAETMQTNIKAVGLPPWTEADVTLAKATQRELGVPEVGLTTEIQRADGQGDRFRTTTSAAADRTTSATSRGRVPTVSLSYPGELPGRSRAQLGERDSDGDADRAQGRERGRAGAGADGARCAAAARARAAGARRTSPTCRRRRGNTSRSSAPAISRRFT